MNALEKAAGHLSKGARHAASRCSPSQHREEEESDSAHFLRRCREGSLRHECERNPAPRRVILGEEEPRGSTVRMCTYRRPLGEGHEGGSEAGVVLRCEAEGA